MRKKTTEKPVESIEPIRDNTALGMDLERIVQKLQKKHEGKLCFAWPLRESVRFKHNGWRPITITESGDSFKEVDSMDDAECTSGTVLCVRNKEVDVMARSRDEDARRRANIAARQERNLATAVGGVNEALQQISGGGLTAKPLSDSDE